MKKNYKRALIFAGIAAVVVCFLVVGFLRRYQMNNRQLKNYTLSATRTVTLDKNGFSPSQLVISQGDTVTFITSAGQDFWPASDPHPTHQIYPEFDAKHNIPSGQSWRFTFQKPGEWSYHDHLDSLHHGVIVVLDSKGKLQPVDCKTTSDKAACWQNDIVSALQNNGLDSAFDVLSNLYNSEPDFSANCHGYTHILGQAAYQEFKQGRDIHLSLKTSYCGYGFYHGFMEALLHTSGNIQEARDFCAYAARQLTGVTGKPNIACYHGIGHGAVDGSDTSAWGKPEQLIGSALNLCEKVGADDHEKYLCGSGVFNALAIAYNQREYSLKGGNPYQDCPLQQKEYFKIACYEEMNTRALAFAGSFPKALNYISSISERQYQMVAVENLAAAASMTAQSADFQSLAKDCLSVAGPLKDNCVAGAAGGLLEGGQPGHEYVSATAFCSLPNLGVNEQNVCFKRLISSVKFLYPADLIPQICGGLPANFQTECLKKY